MEDPKSSRKQFTVFVDADAFVALAREDDSNHYRALRILQFLSQHPVKLLTSNYVFAESITVISQRVGHKAAISYIKETKSVGSSMTMQWVDEKIEQQAIEVFAKQTSKNVSFVDCTTMVILKTTKVDQVFSFDAIYRKNGYHLMQELVEM